MLAKRPTMSSYLLHIGWPNYGMANSWQLSRMLMAIKYSQFMYTHKFDKMHTATKLGHTRNPSWWKATATVCRYHWNSRTTVPRPSQANLVYNRLKIVSMCVCVGTAICQKGYLLWMPRRFPTDCSSQLYVRPKRITINCDSIGLKSTEK